MSINNRLRAAYVLGFASLGSWMPSFTLWLQESAIKKSLIGFIAAVPWIVMLVVQPLWGTLADNAGKRKCLVLGAGASVLLFLAMPLASHAPSIVTVSAVILFLFNTPVLPLLDSITLDQVESGSSASYSSLRFWGAPGFAIGTLAVSQVIGLAGYHAVMYCSAAFIGLFLLVILSIPVPEKRSTSAAISFQGLPSLLADKSLLSFLGVITLVSVAQSASSFYLTVYLQEIGSTPSNTGIALGVQALSELPFYFVAAWLLRWTKASNIILVAIAGTVLRLFLYSVNERASLVIGIELLNGVTWTLLWVASVEYVDGRVPSERRALGQSMLWTAYFGAGAITGNILSGMLYEIMPMQQVFGINALLSLCTGIIAVVIFFSRSGSRRNQLAKYP